MDANEISADSLKPKLPKYSVTVIPFETRAFNATSYPTFLDKFLNRS